MSSDINGHILLGTVEPLFTSVDTTKLILPDSYNGRPVYKIATGAFKYSNIWNVVIPNTIKVIENDVFFGSKNLRHVDFQSNSRLEEIGRQAFRLTGIKEITIPKSVKRIYPHAFSESNIQSLTFEDCSNLKEIGFNAFSGSDFNSLTLSLKDVIIEPKAFSDNRSLKTINLQNSENLCLRHDVFHNCPNLKSVIPPSYGFTFSDDVFPSKEVSESVRNFLLF